MLAIILNVVLSSLAFGQIQGKVELFEALKTAKGGDVLELDGVFEGGVGFGKLKYPDGEPLTIDGMGKTIFKGKPGLSVMDCHNLTVRNIRVEGGVDLNDSYPEFGMRNVSLVGLTVRGPASNGIFMGGHNIDGVFIKNCDVRYIIGGSHAIYLSGGHWDGDYPPIRNVVIYGCIVGYTPGGRNAIQLNGRFDGALIEWNLLQHAQLNGITLIGVQNAVVRHNASYGHNRGSGVVVFDYADGWAHYYNCYETQADIDAFRACHHPSRNILIERNTFVVGPHQFSKDPWHDDDPTENHAGVLVNNAVHSGFSIYKDGQYIDIPRPGTEFDFPSDKIIIKDNVIHTPCLNVLDIYNPHEASVTEVIGNMIYCTKPGIPYIGKSPKVKLLVGNFIEDPDFRQPPKYGFVDLGVNPGYEWEEFKTAFDPFSWPAKQKGKGVGIKADVIWIKGR